MTNFVLVYSGGGTDMVDGMSDEQRDAVMAKWGAWYEELGAGIVDGGNPFGAAKSVTTSGVNDGPVGTPAATGYTIISADSLDDAVAKVQNHPHISFGGQVSVYETLQM